MTYIKLPFITVITLSIGLIGCAAQMQQPLTAQVGTERFTGTITPAYLHKESTMQMSTLNETTHCYGSAQTAAPADFKFNCNKQRGIANFQCDNGQHMTANWYATSCSSGYGYGQDGSGEKFSFEYGAKIGH